ncbi:hypothetical protein BH10CYA1_BH10CYA1_57570 [soil metagenome]
MTSIGTYNSERENMRRRIEQIDSLFTGETDALLYLYGFIPGGLKCHTCQSVHLELQEGDRTALCLLCGKITYLTARTFFHGVRRPIDWVRAIWLLEEGIPFSANMFSSVTGMARASVSSMLSKLLIVISTEMGNFPTERSSSFSQTMTKRSLQTPAMKHPMTEQDVFDEIESESMGESLDLFLEKKLAEIYQSPDDADENSQESNLYSASWANEKNVFKLLSSEPSSFDSIGSAVALNVGELSLALVHLELAGLAKSLSGHMFVQERPIWTDTSVVNKSDEKNVFKPFFQFIARTFHGISRKYLQLYLAAFWCSTSRWRWSVGSLFTVCWRSKCLTYRDRLAYVSPPVVSYYLPNQKS